MRHHTKAAYVHGVAISTSWADAQLSLTDLIFETVTAALLDAGVGMDEVDSVVIASHDVIDGRSLSSMITSPAAGAYLRDEIRLVDDGLVAASLGAARIEAGEAGFTVVAAWGRASEGDFQNTSRAAFDPFMFQPLGLDEFSVSALRLSAWLSRYPGHDQARRRASAVRLARAGNNVRALRENSPAPVLHYPLRAQEGPRMADVVAAAVLGPRESAVRIAGTGHSTDLPYLGDRELLRLPSLQQAAARALDVASKTHEGIDVFELSGATLFDEVFALEVLDLVAPGEGFEAYANSSRFNPSGGSASGWCFPAMGLVGLAECYLQLRGSAGAVQQSGRLRTAMATGVSPVGAQAHSAIVLEAA